MSDETVDVSVVWNYERHSFSMDLSTWREIQSGKTMRLTGKGFEHEGEHFSDIWLFNTNEPGSLIVEYGDGGGTGFDGTVLDAEVRVRSRADS